MSEGKWEEIVYPEVSGRAMMIYRNAFLRHDMERFDRYLMNALEGKEKIHAETLYPYDLVEKILYFNPWDEIMEAQWRQLPDYVAKETNAIVVADVSGSMWIRPMRQRLALPFTLQSGTGVLTTIFL